MTDEEFQALLNLHKPNPLFVIIKKFVLNIIPISLFLGVIGFGSKAPLFVSGGHGDIFSAAFTGLILSYVPNFFEWRSSIEDRNSTPVPAFAFRFLGWVLLLSTLSIVLIYHL